MSRMLYICALRAQFTMDAQPLLTNSPPTKNQFGTKEPVPQVIFGVPPYHLEKDHKRAEKAQGRCEGAIWGLSLGFKLMLKHRK